MKCYHHNDLEAVGICVNCGKALCLECATTYVKEKIYCSEPCRDSNNRFDEAIALIQSKTLKQNVIAAYGTYLAGTVFTLFGLYNFFFKKSSYTPLATFLVVIGICFLVWGTWYWKVGKRNAS